MKPVESKRVALDRKIVLRFPDFDGFVTKYAANLSMTGMFVRSKEPQAAGTPVSFELRLEDGAPLVRGSGWVVWSRSRREGVDRPAGMGVEFTELDHKSRRLVRWMILSQLPEGQPPYDVHDRTASAPETVRLANPLAVRRRRRAGILTAVAIFSALAALIYWSRAGLESPGVRVPGAASGPDVLEKTGFEAVAGVGGTGVGGEKPGDSGVVDASAASGRQPMENGAVSARPAAENQAQRAGQEAPTAKEAAGVTAAEVERTVRNWAVAWSAQDVESYLGYYATDFEPKRGTLAQWKELRRQRLLGPRSIRVAVTRLETTVVSEREARVSFLQTYRSDGYADTVDKVLVMAREHSAWKIRRELAD